MINYKIISDAITFYQLRGYKYIEVPWLVPKETTAITKPSWCRDFETFAGCLVGSGEQSFLEIRSKLDANTKYVCATPCFRDENVDDLHQINFFKVELIVANPINPLNELEVILEHAKEYFELCSEYHSDWPAEIVETKEGKDIFLNGIEIGSYGIREHEGFCWVYGTGCAEPRLSIASNVSVAGRRGLRQIRKSE